MSEMPSMLFGVRVLIVTWLISQFGACAVTNSSQTCTTPQCSCAFDADGHVTATCKVEQFKDLLSFVTAPQNITTLYLSFNHDLYTLPPDGFQNFTTLVNLSLAGNGIGVIAPNAFRGLQNLRFLNISNNRIQWWEGNLTRALSSLETIDLTGNPSWLPTQNVLELESLQEIYGTTWSDACANCDLIKNESNPEVKQYSKGAYGVYVVWHCRGLEYTVTQATRSLGKYGFLPQCFTTNQQCYNTEVKATPSHRCWDIDNTILYMEYLIGVVVIILNITVVAVTVTSPLKRNVAMLLVSNLAVSDCVIGVYSIAITAARQSAPYTEFVTFLNSLCSVLGFLWVLGQFGTIQTSILLTVERYATIIFAMKPALRPTPRMAYASALINWCVAIFAAILPLTGVGSYITNTYCVPIQPSKSVPSSFAYSVGLALYGILLYTITIPLYIHIFLFVRKTGHRAGRVKRDGKIARRIAVLVMSNMVFFFTPIVICVLWLLTDIFKKNISVEARNVLVGVFPTYCFSINSLLNPLLYAFRNTRFKLVLKQKLRKLCTGNSAVADISMRFHSDSKTT